MGLRREELRERDVRAARRGSRWSRHSALVGVTLHQSIPFRLPSWLAARGAEAVLAVARRPARGLPNLVNQRFEGRQLWGARLRGAAPDRAIAAVDFHPEVGAIDIHNLDDIWTFAISWIAVIRRQVTRRLKSAGQSSMRRASNRAHVSAARSDEVIPFVLDSTVSIDRHGVHGARSVTMHAPEPEDRRRPIQLRRFGQAWAISIRIDLSDPDPVVRSPPAVSFRTLAVWDVVQGAASGVEQGKPDEPGSTPATTTCGRSREEGCARWRVAGASLTGHSRGEGALDCAEYCRQ